MVSFYFQGHILDLRSLALFRILFGLYLLYDIYSRLCDTRYDIYWYTSIPSELSFQSPNDTPHNAPLHRLWFYRGTAVVQYGLFGFTALLAGFLCVGWPRNSIKLQTCIKIGLFVLVTSYQNLNMHVHDGSDSFMRHLLFWSIFLPLHSDVEIVTMFKNLVYRPQPQRKRSVNTVSGLPCLALTVQILLMYWGTMAGRTLEKYNPSSHKSFWEQMQRSQWMNLTAVHYALNGSFATRNHILINLIRSTPLLSQSMTGMSCIIETFIPLLCLLHGQKRHWYALILFLFHFGLLVCINLPNWQFVAMLLTVIWIPSHVWDGEENQETDAISQYKKTDEIESATNSKITITALRSNRVSHLIQLFFFVYMLYNWCGQRQWIPKHDNGNIGEALRLSQYWVMYATVSTTATNTYLTGIVDTTATTKLLPLEDDDYTVDLYHYLKSGKIRHETTDEKEIENMSDQYPSPRWERALHSYDKDIRKTRHFLKAVCRLINVDGAQSIDLQLSAIEMRFRYLELTPLEDTINRGTFQRYRQRSKPDLVVSESCELIS
mmetsp:Transcript_2936/g.3443  ORF Transcript_2936/g.3443 Transcript_2936/m.3443 type:complete len:548 (-) Transcript_2936:42-1685(-)